MLRVILGAFIIVATLAAIVIRPYRFPEAASAVAGAMLLVLGGFLPVTDAMGALASQTNVFGFFLGLMTISAVADQAGLFDMLTFRAAQLAGGRTRRLYLAIFGLGILTTAFLSNDATALILTPVVYALVTRLRLSPLPFLFACTFIADTASFLLPVSNPINVLVLDTFGGNLLTFLRFLLLPSLLCIALNVGAFALIFRREVSGSYRRDALPTPSPLSGFARFTLISLGLIALGYLLASIRQLPLAFIALGGSALLLAGAGFYRRLDWSHLRREISWSLFIFVGGLFILVRSAEHLGLLTAFSQTLVRLGSASSPLAVLAVAGGTAIGANLINNVPMALLMTSALHTAGAGGAPQPLVYATILGADLGPNITTVGSLATILWLLILRRKGVDISTREYLKLGLTIVPVMLVIGSLVIWLVR